MFRRCRYMTVGRYMTNGYFLFGIWCLMSNEASSNFWCMMSCFTKWSTICIHIIITASTFNRNICVFFSNLVFAHLRYVCKYLQCSGSWANISLLTNKCQLNNKLIVKQHFLQIIKWPFLQIDCHIILPFVRRHISMCIFQ